MNEHDMKIIQMAIGYAEDVIRKVVVDNGMEPHELDKKGYEFLSDAFYAMNTCWLNIQYKYFEKDGGEQ